MGTMSRNVLFVCIAWFAVGCGDATRDRRDAKRDFVISVDGAEQSDAQSRSIRVAHCETASVELGKGRAAIEFEVSCTGPASGGRAQFAVERYLPGNPIRMRGPHRYAGSLEVRGESGMEHRGRCRAKQRILECQARVSGAMSLEGRFSTEKSACRLAVSVIEVGVKGSCDRGGCQKPVRARELFDGPPGGC